MKPLLFSLFFISVLWANDTIKGQTFYLYLLKDQLGYNGAVFAKQFTKEQWQEMFENDAKGLKQFLHKQNPELKTFTASKKFEKITPYLNAFVTSYAKDVKSSPECN